MPRSTADQAITLACSLLAVTVASAGVWLLYRRHFWWALLTLPLLTVLGAGIYFFGFFRFTRLF